MNHVALTQDGNAEDGKGSSCYLGSQQLERERDLVEDDPGDWDHQEEKGPREKIARK